MNVNASDKDHKQFGFSQSKCQITLPNLMYVLYQINLVYSFCNYLTCDDWIIYMILSYFHPVYQKESYIHFIYIEFGS